MYFVEFGFGGSRGFVSARGQFWPIAIDRPTRPYNIASTALQQVICALTDTGAGCCILFGALYRKPSNVLKVVRSTATTYIR
jgi:hypothetical protein